MRAPARSYLANIGYGPKDLRQPIVGVSHSWTTSPCNINTASSPNASSGRPGRPAARRWSSSTIAVADGIVMGAAGMRASLISRKVVADPSSSSPGRTISTC